MKTASMPVQRSHALLDEWKVRLKALNSQVISWVETQPGWRVEQSTKEITEKQLGSYTADVLTIEDEQERRLLLEPIARMVPGGEGIVELYGWSTLNRVRLLPHGEDWDVLTDSGIKLHQAWNCESFVILAQDLMADRSRLSILRQARGIWRERRDLPDPAELRNEWDRP